MIICDTIAPLRQQIKEWKQQEKTIALVPTMGNLHKGHLSLIEEAKLRADITIATIFVNPTQFDKQEDLDHYPRSLDNDLKKLKESKCDLVFTPSTAEIYGLNNTTQINISGISEILEGASRQGHFSGVATIVAKLFNLTSPEFAIFGKKDFQQLKLIQQMVSHLNFDIQVIGKETYREQDGLAMSSRNSHLTIQQRKIAPALSQQLIKIKEEILQGNHNYQQLSQDACKQLNQLGFQTDYVTICRQRDLLPAGKTDKELVILAAAQLGKPRLIDNMILSI